MNNARSSRLVPRRDLRVTRRMGGRVALWQRPAINRSAVAFVQGILHRYGGRRAMPTPLDRIFRQHVLPVLYAAHSHRHEHRIGLRLHHLHRVVRETTVIRPFFVDRVVASGTTTGAALPVPSFVERIFARERRVESTATIRSVVERIVGERGGNRPGVLPPVAVVRPAPDVPMIVRRPPPLRAQPEPAPASAPQIRVSDDWNTLPGRVRAATAAAPIPLTPLELHRVTDHVVNAIDRRFIAHRERHGRI